MKALYTFPQSVGIAGGRPSSSYYFVGLQEDDLFYLDLHYTRATISLLPSTQAPDRGIPTMQITPDRGSVSPPAIIVRLLPVARVHLLFHSQRLRHPLIKATVNK